MKRVTVIILLCCFFSGCSGIKPPRSNPSFERVMETTGYCKCGKCCGWKRNWLLQPIYTGGSNKGKRKIVGQTASGAMAEHGTIAADISLYPYGTIMYVEGYGYGRVEDVGGAIRGQHIDLYFTSHRQAAEWGSRKKTVKIWLVGK